MTSPSRFAIAALAVVGVVLLVMFLVVAGNLLYSDGLGTPGEFRDRVQATGLDVAWESNGYSGGTGVVETDCGPRLVSISQLEDQLWFAYPDPSVSGEASISADSLVLLTPESIKAILSCTP